MAKRAPKVILEGQEELYARLKAIQKVVRKEVGTMNREAALRGLDLARQLVPVVTGELLTSLDIRGSGVSWRYGSFGYESRNNAPVGWWVEHGTSRSPAHPFLRPSAEVATAYVHKQNRVISQDLPFKVRSAA